MTARMITVRIAQFGDEGWFFAHSDDDASLKLCAPSLEQMRNVVKAAVHMESLNISFRIQLDETPREPSCAIAAIG